MAQSPFADYLARFDAGDAIFTVGEEGQTLFVIQSGVIDLVAKDGEEVLSTLEKGDFFGEMSLLEGTPRTYSAVARQDAETIEIGAALFDRMIRSNIELAVRMLRKLSFRLAQAESRLSTAQRPPLAADRGVAEPPEAVRPEDPPQVLDDAPPPTQKKGANAETAPAGQGTACLIHLEGSEVFLLQGTRVHVGRFDPVTGIRPEVDLTLLDLKRSVSRRHAILSLDDEGYTISEEVGALNGTEVNGDQVNPGAQVRIRHGDDVAFGGVILRFQTTTP
ncbi:MAG: cyclic nucleotide-binding domain-containing protein [Acidobacteria bacterium]|nr:MAG: cyclic nucleotide-binding domain-containing protein [Acidobacteriota bacterium]